MDETNGEEIQYGTTFTMDGQEQRPHVCESLAQAYRHVANMMRHHERHGVAGRVSGYRIVKRTLSVGPWESADG